MTFFSFHGHRIVEVAECGCWVWTGALDRNGYGRHGAGNNRTASAHRSAYAEAFGPIPEGIAVCHRCDVPACVNPGHLFLGTQKENVEDMARKGRHGKARIRAEQAAEIKRRLRDGETHRSIAADFDLDRSTVTQISQNRTWRHVQ